MKTIKFLADTISLMEANGTPADITVGTFKIESRGSLHFWAGRTGTFDNYKLTFQIEFRPDHIQHLIDMGVKIDFNTVASSMSAKSCYYVTGRAAIKLGRYYARTGGVAENWLTATATCDIDTLTQLDKVCRDNHLHHIAIHNDTVTGWQKVRIANPRTPSVFYKKIRQNIAKKNKKHADLLPIEQIALTTK